MTSGLSTLRRVPVVAWVALLLVLAAGVTALLGGFERHTGRWLGPEMVLGETVDTRFWDVTVLDARIDSIGPWVDVDLEITNKTSEGTAFFTSYMLLGRIDDPRTNLDFSYCRTDGDRPFNPGVTVFATCQFKPQEGDVVDIEGVTSLPVTISVLDQRLTNELLGGQSDIISSPAGQYNITAPVVER